MDDLRPGISIGPISLFTLVASLGMAVLAVLAISTSNAMYALSHRSATMTTEIYLADVCGQRMVAELDEVLADVRTSGGDVRLAVESALPQLVAAAQAEADPLGLADESVEVQARMDGSDVVASVVTPAFRRIDLRVAVNDDGTYQIMEWKATSEADSTVAEETLWSPVG